MHDTLAQSSAPNRYCWNDCSGHGMAASSSSSSSAYANAAIDAAARSMDHSRRVAYCYHPDVGSEMHLLLIRNLRAEDAGDPRNPSAKTFHR